jgi:hypothetical protein
MINTQTNILGTLCQIHPALSRNWEETKGQNLYWRQPKRLRNEFVFGSQNQTWGTLQYQEDHYIRRATAKTADRQWNFKYTRFSLPKVTITQHHNLIAQTILETNWGWRGTLILPNEGRYTWELIDETEKGFRFLTDDGYPLISFHPRFGFLKLEAQVDIAPSVSHHPHLPLLTMLGWFLILIRTS